MKSFIKTAALSILTVGSLSLAVIPQSQAFTGQLKSTIPITNKTIYRPQPEVDLSQSQVSKGELVASFSCRYRSVNGRLFYCCADSYGNVDCSG
jgi:hypothetical protein